MKDVQKFLSGDRPLNLALALKKMRLYLYGNTRTYTKRKSERRRFTWDNFRGSIYVVNEGGDWGWIAVSEKRLIELAKVVLGDPDPEPRNALDGIYETWSNANPYKLADLLYKADQMLCK